MPRAIVGIRCFRLLWGALCVDQGDRRSCADLSLVETLFGEGIALGDASVLRDLTDAQMIIEQDFGAAFLLRHVMAHPCTPSNYRLLVSPPRERKNPSITCQAL